jgi:RNA recognition motif-containing protein
MGFESPAPLNPLLLVLKGGGLTKSPQGNGNSKNNELASGMISYDDKNKSNNNKLWLSSKLLVPQPAVTGNASFDDASSEPEEEAPAAAVEEGNEEELREKGKIFVGNLPLWIKKEEVAEFFRQFGPIQNVILIRGHEDPERNVGYCFVIYGGPSADNCAAKAVEFDGVEFRGKVLTVKLDDGRRLRAVAERRGKWVRGIGRDDEHQHYRSTWHEHRENASKEFKRILETHPHKWQQVLNAFLKISKVSHGMDHGYGFNINFHSLSICHRKVTTLHACILIENKSPLHAHCHPNPLT